MSRIDDLVLEAIEYLTREDKDGAWGASVARFCHERSGREPPIIAIYNAASRLEDRGLIGHHHMPGGPERGFRKKRCWTLGVGQRERIQKQQEQSNADTPQGPMG